MNTSPRRTFLKTSLTSALALAAGAVLAAPSKPGSEDEGISTPSSKKPVTSEQLFRLGVIGPASLSLAICEIAVKTATNKNAKEFAGFELAEAIAVTAVLKDLGTPVLPMDSKAKATLEELQSAKGGAFDKAFIEAQLESHEFLRDHAMDYLDQTKDKTEVPEQHGRHLATLSLAVFKEHVAITKRILEELKN